MSPMSDIPLQASAIQCSLPSPLQRAPFDTMKTIDEMLHLDLLTHEQHHQIGAWIAQADSPEEILKMPAPLWQAVERASKVMRIDDDLTRPPALSDFAED